MSKQITADKLSHEARIHEYIDRQRAEWEAKDALNGRPPSEDKLAEREMIEASAWDDFYDEDGTKFCLMGPKGDGTQFSDGTLWHTSFFKYPHTSWKKRGVVRLYGTQL